MLRVVKSRVVWTVIAALLLSGASFGVSITFSVKLSAALKPGDFARGICFIASATRYHWDQEQGSSRWRRVIRDEWFT